MGFLNRYWDEDDYYGPSDEELKRRREEQDARELEEAKNKIQDEALASTRAFLFTLNGVVYLLPEIYRHKVEKFKSPIHPDNLEEAYAKFHERFKVFDFSLMRNTPLNVRVNTEAYQNFQKIAWYRKQRLEDFKLNDPESYGITLK